MSIFERFIIAKTEMEKNEITLFCVNDGKNHKIEKGKSLKDLADR